MCVFSFLINFSGFELNVNKQKLSSLVSYNWVEIINIESLQNRLLKVCYVPAIGASLIGFFFAVAINSIHEAKKAGSTCR
jgi:hypothetical protein